MNEFDIEVVRNRISNLNREIFKLYQEKWDLELKIMRRGVLGDEFQKTIDALKGIECR